VLAGSGWQAWRPFPLRLAEFGLTGLGDRAGDRSAASEDSTARGHRGTLSERLRLAVVAGGSFSFSKSPVTH